MNNKPYPVVCLWACSWAGLWQRQQQLMSRLAARHRILYVESPRDFVSVVRNWRKVGWRQLTVGREVMANVTVFTPVVPFSLRRYPRLNRIWLALLRPWVRHLMRRWQCEQPFLWVCYPLAESLVGRLGERIACYDCCDELTDLPTKLAGIIREHEDRLLAKAQVVFATSESLLRSLSARHAYVHLIPNGADAAHFARAATELLPCPPELSALPRPIIGFIGAVQHWVDVTLLAEAARLRPQWSWVVIGGVHKDVSCLSGLANVHLLGPKPYAALPSYLRQMCVGLVPFELCPIALAADPIKVYEYLAAGKPVVATAIPRLEVFGDAVRIARNVEEFVTQIQRALAEDSPEAGRRRRELASAHSWEQRTREIAKHALR
ncbi:MAG: glycosyltransferase family 1 protein [Verrucomicrobia bacterium]|nr:glycosyltransferase family 1 protein [Verrucomicrobiota bacterium]